MSQPSVQSQIARALLQAQANRQNGPVRLRRATVLKSVFQNAPRLAFGPHWPLAGERTVSVPLGLKSPGVRYTAIIPVGPDTPTLPVDPNTVGRFWVKRETSRSADYAGPFLVR